ncbi:MAG: ATP-dependent helicase, partial [Chloroflexota bacterium]
RTARAGSVGEAVSFVTPNDARIWKSIERILNLPKEKNSDSMKTTVSSRKFKRRGFKRRGSKRR